jgi:glycosyltransferase involved in cell wall biosynthesis
MNKPTKILICRSLIQNDLNIYTDIRRQWKYVSIQIWLHDFNFIVSHLSKYDRFINIICVSEFHQNYINNILKKYEYLFTKTTYIHYAIFSKCLETYQIYTGKKKQAIFVSELYKGSFQVIDLFIRFKHYKKEEYAEYILVICTPGHELGPIWPKILLEYIQHIPYIFYIGKLSRFDRYKYIAESSCVIAGPYDEPFGMIYAESYEIGTHVLAPRICGGIPEIIGIHNTISYHSKYVLQKLEWIFMNPFKTNTNLPPLYENACTQMWLTYVL